MRVIDCVLDHTLGYFNKTYCPKKAVRYKI